MWLLVLPKPKTSNRMLSIRDNFSVQNTFPLQVAPSVWPSVLVLSMDTSCFQRSVSNTPGTSRAFCECACTNQLWSWVHKDGMCHIFNFGSWEFHQLSSSLSVCFALCCGKCLSSWVPFSPASVSLSFRGALFAIRLRNEFGRLIGALFPAEAERMC